MKNSLRLILATSVLAILTACGNNTTSSSTESSASSTGGSTQLAQSVNAYRPPESSSTAESPMKVREPSTAPTATNIAMGAPLESLTAAARKNNETTAEDNMGKPL